MANSGAGGSSPVITNCIFWANADNGGVNQAAQIHTQFGSPIVSFCLVQGGYAGTGNINADPGFADPNGPDDILGTADDDLRILPGSPCIDAGSSPAVPADIADLDGDGNTSEPTPLDLAGKKRFVDDPRTPNTGIPGSPVVDMGAYEYFPDCNNNDIDDADDIAADPSIDTNPMDGIPDSCCFCAAAGVWSNPMTWNCGNVPDNGAPSPGDRYNVNITCPVPAVTLDVPVTIDSVVVAPGKALSVTGVRFDHRSASGFKKRQPQRRRGTQIIAQRPCVLEGVADHAGQRDGVVFLQHRIGGRHPAPLSCGTRRTRPPYQSADRRSAPTSPAVPSVLPAQTPR
jgi:hypothetical protein